MTILAAIAGVVALAGLVAAYYYRRRYVQERDHAAMVTAALTSYQERAKALAVHIRTLEAARNARAAIQRKKDHSEATAIRDSDDAVRARDFLRDSLPHGK